MAIFKKFRIAYLSLERPHEGSAAFTHVNEIIRGMLKIGHSIDLYAPANSGKRLSNWVFYRFIASLVIQARLIFHWRAYDAVYVRGHYLAAPVAFLARLTGKPICHEVNGPFTDLAVTHPWTRYIDRPLRMLQRFQYRWADGLVAVTPQLERWLRSEGCMNAIVVVPNGANLSNFNPKLSQYPGLPEKYVIFFGGFARWQGIPVMLEAASDPAWPKDVAIVFVGDGQLRAEVEEGARANKNVLYVGKLRHTEVGKAVVGAIAGLVPKIRASDSDDTGLFPVKLFEILACGVPAVVTDYPGQADLVRSADCGLVLPPFDSKALAMAVAKLAADPVEAAAMGRRGHELIVRSHSWEQRATQTADLLAQLVHR